MNNDDWRGLTFMIGVCLGSALTLQIVSALAEYRHKRQLHGRLNQVEGRLTNLKQETKKKIEGLGLVPQREAVS